MHDKIYIVLTKTGTNFSKFLSLVSGIEHPHVSLSLTKDLKKLYSFGRQCFYFPLIGGFVEEERTKGIFARYKDTNCVVFEMPVTAEEYMRLVFLIENFQSSRGYFNYNFLGLFALALDIPLSRKYHFFCSQFVAYLLDRANIIDFEKDSSLVTSKDFYDIKNKRLIYSGKLKEYKQA